MDLLPVVVSETGAKSIVVEEESHRRADGPVQQQFHYVESPGRELMLADAVRLSYLLTCGGCARMDSSVTTNEK